MLYDLSNPLQREQFKSRATLLCNRGSVVELSAKTNRSLAQNAYLHTLLAYFGLHYGETADYVKHEFFKKTVNPELFVVEKENPIRGRYKTLRSTASLTKEEMSTAITRFRDWSAKEANIYLPTPSEGEMLRAMEIEVSRAKEFV